VENKNKVKKAKLIKAAMFGTLVGTTMGLLLAPKSGKELRQDLTEQAHEMGDKALIIRDKAQSAWQNVEDKTQMTINNSKNLVQKCRRMIDNLKILVYEIENGALTQTSCINSSEDIDCDDLTKEIMIIENEHEC